METDIAVLYLEVTEGSWGMDRYVNMILVLLDSEIISIQSEHGFLFMLHGVHICIYALHNNSRVEGRTQLIPIAISTVCWKTHLPYKSDMLSIKIVNTLMMSV
jgi:hypothetical protein